MEKKNSLLSKFIMVLFVLIIGLYYALISPYFHKKIASKALLELKKEFGTNLTIDSATINYFGKINLYGLKAKDHKNLEFITIGEIEAKMNLISFIKNSNFLKFNSLKLVNPVVKVFTYKKDSIDNFTIFTRKFNNKKNIKPTKPFTLAGNFIIENGRWTIFNLNNPTSNQELLNSSNLNGEINNLKVNKNKIYAELKDLSFNATKNNKKYQLNNFSTVFSTDTKYMYFDNLLLKTSKSNLEGYIHFDYNKIKDFKDFSNKINLKLNLIKGSYANYYDLNYFLKNLNATTIVNINGKATGKINDLRLIDFKLENELNKFSASKILLKNNTINQKSFDIKAKEIDLKTSMAGLNNLLPGKISKKIPQLINNFGLINYKGNFDINKNLIVANGNFNSSIGKIDIKNLNLKNYSNKEKITYFGKLITSNFDLEKIAKIKKIGLLNSDFIISGKGLDKNATIDLKGYVNNINLFNKEINQIKLDGELKNQKFLGLISFKDSKINGNYNGILDFSDPNLKFKFNSKIQKIDLQSLGLSKEKAILSANFIGDLNFSTIEDVLGEIKISEFKLEKENGNYYSNDIKIISNKSQLYNKKYNINIPNIIFGNLEGNFKLKNLPNLILSSSKKIIEKENQFNKIDSEKEIVLLDLSIQNDFFKMFYPSVNIGEEYLILRGEINELKNKVNLEATVKQIKINKTTLYGSTILIDNQSPFNPMLIEVDKADFGKFKANKLLLETYKPNSDSLKIKTSFNIEGKNTTRFNLNLFQTKKDDLVEVGFLKSDIIINNKIWDISTPTNKLDNLFEYNTINKKITANNFSLTRKNQSLILNLNYQNKDDYYINLNLKDLMLEEIIPVGALKNSEFKGIINGQLDLVKTPKELLPIIKTEISNFTLNNIFLGNLNFESNLNSKNNVFDTKLILFDENNSESLIIDGFVDNKGIEPIINSNLEFKDKKMDFLNIILKDVFNEFKGNLSGNLKIYGPLKNINYSGKLFAKDMGFKINYLNTKYFFNNKTEIEVNNKSLNILKTEFFDTKEKTNGYANGIVNLNDFKKIDLDLTFNSNKLLVLDTTFENNESFFGNLYLNGNIDIFGPANNLSIVAKGDIFNESNFSINLDKTEIAQENKVVSFVPSIKKIVESDSIEIKTNTEIIKNGLSLDFTLSIKPDSEINIIFDNKSGDKLVAIGQSEKFNFKRDKNGNMSLNGLYELNKGVYNFRRILNKDFILSKGSTISWTGDIYKAELDLTATYRRIVSNVGEYLGVESSQSIDTNLIISLKNQLFKPDISFDIQSPLAPIQIQNDLSTKFSDSDELKRQFGAIIATGKFLTNNPNAEALTSSAYEVGLKQISEAISSFNKNINVDLEYNQGNQLNATSDNFRTAVNLRISDRFNLNTAFGINLTNNNIINNVNNNFFGQFELEYDITKNNNGNIILKTFSKPTIFGIDNYNANSINENNNTTINFAQSFGFGLVYRKSFNTLKELFLKVK